MTLSRDHDAQMLTALVQLRGALQTSRLPLDLPGVEEPRAARQRMIDQLEDYVIPRQTSIDAPLLAVVGGSTGAGKSTLVNTLVGRRVTASGLLRPTTRSPVLVHHPDDARWFGQDRLLPDLVRVSHATDDQGSLQLVAADTMPPGLAVLDAPDVDSVEERNRSLAAQLLAAGDLWLFVTSAARYSDQVPWEFLKQAAERSAAVAIVLDRTPADAVGTVAAHLARMLASRGLKDSPLFTVNEAPVDEEGLLPAAEVADIRGWLASLADDVEARALVVKQTLDGAIRTVARETHVVADAAQDQVGEIGRLRELVASAYDEAVERAVAESGDGTLIRGEVLARWQELVGTGELLRSVENKVSRLRELVVSAVKGTPHHAERVTVAIESGLELLVLDRAERAATSTWAAWESTPAGRSVLAAEDVGLGRASRELRRRAEREARVWQQEVLELVRAEGADKRTSARFLTFGVNGLGAALMVTVLARSIATGPDDPSTLGRKLLEAVFGPAVLETMVARAGAALERRLTDLLRRDGDRWLDLLGGLDVPPDAAEQLRSASRRIDDLRFEQARTATGPMN